MQIEDQKYIYCWKCGNKIPEPGRLDWSNKACNECSQEVYKIFNKYGPWEYIPVTGCVTQVGLTDRPNWSNYEEMKDIITLKAFGFDEQYDSYLLKKKKYSHINVIFCGPIIHYNKE